MASVTASLADDDETRSVEIADERRGGSGRK
jgi:hypothetical protein